MPDHIFDHPRLARVYDAFHADRRDLDAYVAIVAEFAAADVLDVGCGTGALASRLAGAGVSVVGVDPALASLDVAKAKPHAERIRFVHGTARDALPLQVDVALMTGNVAQVFLTDAEWLETLSAVRSALRPGGRFVFEARVPERRGWEAWTKDATWEVIDVPHEGPVEDWAHVTDVDGEYVTFESPKVFRRDGVRIDSTSTLRFRTREALEASLRASGFTVDEVRDAPDRPGAEYVFVASRA